LNILVIILVLVIIACVVRNVSLIKKVKLYIQANKGVATLNVLQEFMKVMGQDINASRKINKLNEILFQGYDIQFSSIVVFDGVSYIVKASNVPSNEWEYLSTLHNDPEFSESIATANTKYLKTDSDNPSLKYSTAIQRNIKSAMFFPLYIENVYIGYWIIESQKEKAFDNIESETLEIIKSNISLVLQGMSYQDAIESMVMQDKFTGLNSRDYLYSEGKSSLNKHVISSVVLFEITNLEEINEELGRESGNMCVTEVSKRVSEQLADTSIFVRYMGPKFAIAFPGSQIEDLTDVLNNIKHAIEDDKVKAKGRKYSHPQINLVAGAYYKGTGLDSLIKRLENRLAETKEENTITLI